jgi:hypothetical protein
VAVDLGHGHSLRYFGWAPDRRLNPQHEGRPDVEHAGAIIAHPNARTGEPCEGAVMFDLPETRHLSGTRWTVESWEPLTLSPSVLCSCGDHGHVRGGRWEPA